MGVFGRIARMQFGQYILQHIFDDLHGIVRFFIALLILIIFVLIIFAQYILSIIFAPRKGRIAQLDRAPAF